MKMKRKFGIATLAATLAGTGIMGGFMSTSVLADPPNQNTDVIPYYDETADPNLAITKSIPTGKGTNVSEGQIATPRTYTFTFTKKPGTEVPDGGGSASTVENLTSPADATQTPDIGPVSVTVDPKNASTDAGSGQNTNNGENSATTTLKTSDDTTDYYKAETQDWLIKDDWKNAPVGVHVYEVTETAIDPTLDNKDISAAAPGETVETLTQSQAVYRVYVYVREKTNTPGENYVYAVTVAKTKDDNGTQIAQDKIEKENSESGAQGELSDFEYNNNYKKQTKPEDDDPRKKPYGVYKQVLGMSDNNESPNQLTNNEVMFGSETVSDDWATTRGAKADKFKFTITLTRGNADNAESYDAYIYTSKDNDKYNKGDKVTFEFGADGKATKTVELAHYQCLAFEDNLPVGTGYEVVEDEYKPHTNSGYDYTVYVGATSNPESTDRKDSGTVKENAESKSLYFNDAESGTTPTGVLTNYLPFFIIIGGAIAGAVAIVVAKGKKRGDSVQ